MTNLLLLGMVNWSCCHSVSYITREPDDYVKLRILDLIGVGLFVMKWKMRSKLMKLGVCL